MSFLDNFWTSFVGSSWVIFVEGDKDKYVMFSHMGGNLSVIRSASWGVPPHDLIKINVDASFVSENGYLKTNRLSCNRSRKV